MTEEERFAFVRFTIAKVLADGHDPGANENVMASLIMAVLARSGFLILPVSEVPEGEWVEMTDIRSLIADTFDRLQAGDGKWEYDRIMTGLPRITKGHHDD